MGSNEDSSVTKGSNDDSSVTKGSNDDSSVAKEEYFVFKLALISSQSLSLPQWSLSTSLLGRRIQTYAQVWIDKDAKFLTQIDENGGSQLVWNHRFLFIVDKSFLTDKDKYINIEIYAAGAASLMLSGGYIGNCRIQISPLVVWKYELSGKVVTQGLIHAQIKLMPFEQFKKNTDMVWDVAMQQKRLSIMCLHCQPGSKGHIPDDFYLMRFGVVFFSACWLFAHYALPKLLVLRERYK
ncbi:Replicase polyprotein 1a [Bienertia sinuspersici]